MDITLTLSESAVVQLKERAGQLDVSLHDFALKLFHDSLLSESLAWNIPIDNHDNRANGDLSELHATVARIRATPPNPSMIVPPTKTIDEVMAYWEANPPTEDDIAPNDWDVLWANFDIKRNQNMAPLTQLPADLPIPIDDGAADHLAGMTLPDITLSSTHGGEVNLSTLSGLTVIYLYPMTGRPDTPLPDGWEQIPGARGCTPQSCSFRDHYAALQALGAGVYGLSTQSTAYQQEAAARLHLPFALLSDESLNLTDALSLPTMDVEGRTLIKRTTLICQDALIKHVFYPVFPPDKNVEQVIEWLTQPERML